MLNGKGRRLPSFFSSDNALMTSSAPSLLRSSGMRWLAAGSLVLTLSAPLPSMAQAGSVYYVCPGNVFTNTLSAKEAAQKGCKAKEATEPTTISGPKPRRHLRAGQWRRRRGQGGPQRAEGP
jgi:hypothetical protein